MTRSINILLLSLALGAPFATLAETSGTETPKTPEVQFSQDDFGIGRKHTGNAWCNRKVDAILEETRQCFNKHPDAECRELQKKNSKKMGAYLRSPRCIK